MFADYYLKGQDGWRESERDGRRREMPQYDPLRCLQRMGLMWNYQLTGLFKKLLRMNCKG